MKRIWMVLLVLLWMKMAGEVRAAEVKEMESEGSMEAVFYESLNLDEIETALKAFAGTEGFSFQEAVKSLITGEIPFDLENLKKTAADVFWGEMRDQKNGAARILAVVLASAVFGSFVKVFEKSQIAEISFYMMYLLISTMLAGNFRSMSEMVARTCTDLSAVMKLLMPSYLVTVVLSAGSVTAAGFYEVILLAMNLMQIFMIKLVLPAINFYLILLILNQMDREDYFSRLAEFVELLISWILKGILGIVLGFQAVQCLVTPAVDSLKNSAMHRLIKVIPGFGNVLDTAAETVAGSAVVIKNAVGIAGMLLLAAICLTPLVKLLACILIFRLLCALIQPFCEKRMVEGVESISRGTLLLLRVQMTGLAVFLISLAMITASIRGG